MNNKNGFINSFIKRIVFFLLAGILLISGFRLLFPPTTFRTDEVSEISARFADMYGFSTIAFKPFYYTVGVGVMSGVDTDTIQRYKKADSISALAKAVKHEYITQYSGYSPEYQLGSTDTTEVQAILEKFDLYNVAAANSTNQMAPIAHTLKLCLLVKEVSTEEEGSKEKEYSAKLIGANEKIMTMLVKSASVYLDQLTKYVNYDNTLREAVVRAAQNADGSRAISREEFQTLSISLVGRAQDIRAADIEIAKLQKDIKHTQRAVRGLLKAAGTTYYANSGQEDPLEALVLFHERPGQGEDTLMDPLVVGGRTVVPLVMHSINDKNMPLRRYAIGSLGQLKDRRALNLLERIARDKSEIDYFRGDALEAMALIDLKIAEELAKGFARSDQSYLGDRSLDIIKHGTKNIFKRSYEDALEYRHND